MRSTEWARSASKQTSLLLSLLFATLGPEAAAEEAGPLGVAGSGMQQRTGAIANRSDVSMSVESLPGTSALRLGAIGEAVGTQMTAIRTCYVDVAESRPTVQGTLRLSIQIPEGRGATRLEIAENTTGDQELVDCVTGAIRRAPLMRVPGPAGGLIVIEFQNTAAEGAALVARSGEQASALVQTVDGHPQARASTPSGEVELIVAGTDTTSTEAVATLFQAAQARIGTMLDCRRRAGRRGAEPGGEIVLAFRVPPRGAAAGSRVSSSVADPNAPNCVLQSLRQSAQGESRAAGSYRITVRFAPR